MKISDSVLSKLNNISWNDTDSKSWRVVTMNAIASGIYEAIDASVKAVNVNYASGVSIPSGVFLQPKATLETMLLSINSGDFYEIFDVVEKWLNLVNGGMATIENTMTSPKFYVSMSAFVTPLYASMKLARTHNDSWNLIGDTMQDAITASTPIIGVDSKAQAVILTPTMTAIW